MPKFYELKAYNFVVAPALNRGIKLTSANWRAGLRPASRSITVLVVLARDRRVSCVDESHELVAAVGALAVEKVCLGTLDPPVRQ